MHRQEPRPRTRLLQVGVVSSGAEILWIGAAKTRHMLAEELVDYLLPRCVYQLEDADRDQFRRLLLQGQPQRAVDLYFATVGRRWDEERLSVVTRRVRVCEDAPEEAERAVLQ